MATFNYYLREPKSTKATPITLFVVAHGKIKKIKTDQKIEPKFWDAVKQKVKSSYEASVELNAFLSSFLVNTQKAYVNSLTDGEIPTAKVLREKIKAPKERKETNIKDYLQHYIDTMRALKAPNTSKKYEGTLNHLKNFQAIHPEYRTFESINQIFYDEFVAYLHSKDLNNNTVCKYVKAIKAFLQWTFDREFHSNLAFKRFKGREYPVDVIYLNERELFKIYNLDLKFDKVQAEVRDAFCFSCFTGQRFSDVENLKWEDILLNTWIVHTKKTRERIEIPLNKFALQILAKYKGCPRPLVVHSNTDCNFYLKKIAESADIKENVKIISYGANKKKETIHPKWELITTHVARKTFVTLSLQWGMRPETVMEITGHKDFRTLQKYIKITSKVKETEMNRIWDKAVA